MVYIYFLLHYVRVHVLVYSVLSDICVTPCLVARLNELNRNMGILVVKGNFVILQVYTEKKHICIHNPSITYIDFNQLVWEMY